ncbi:MAG: hypothetical protein ACREQX_07940 [Candidatus Binataceae bacterium]
MRRGKTLSFLLGLCAVCILGAGQASAKSKKPRVVRVRVDSVLAADTHEGMDQRLNPHMAERFKALFDYSTYRLVRHQEQEAVCGRMLSFNLPGGRILHIAPRSVEGNMITMELMLFQGSRPIMTTDLKLMDGGVLIVGGPRYAQGMLITSIVVASVGGAKDQSRQWDQPQPPQIDHTRAEPASLPTGP